MVEYHKIETPFMRDVEGTKKLMDGKYRNECVEFLADKEWVCTEKIDGTNIGVVWDGHKVSYQGRTERASIPAFLMNKLIDLFGDHETEELFEQKFGDMKVILFGEGYGPKIQKCGCNYRSDVSFILFDVYIPEQDLWLERESVENIAKTFWIDVVPIVMEGTIEEAINFVKTKPKSTFGNADMEGLVCRPKIELKDRRGNRIITKIKVVDFA